MVMLSEPALALTDLALGLVTLALAARVRAVPGIHHSWLLTLTWTGVAAMSGFVHHGFVTFSDTLDDPSFAVVSMMVVVAVSYLLSATVYEVLGPGRRRAFWLLRIASLGAYGALALGGRAGASSILMAEGVTMLLILILWVRGYRRGHPLAPRVIAAFLVSGSAAAVQAIPASTRIAGLDPISMYHLAQIPGIVLLYLAIVSPHAAPSHDRPGLAATG